MATDARPSLGPRSDSDGQALFQSKRGLRYDLLYAEKVCIRACGILKLRIVHINYMVL